MTPEHSIGTENNEASDLLGAADDGSDDTLGGGISISDLTTDITSNGSDDEDDTVISTAPDIEQAATPSTATESETEESDNN
jgi:hypothetical protein